MVGDVAARATTGDRNRPGTRNAARASRSMYPLAAYPAAQEGMAWWCGAPFTSSQAHEVVGEHGRRKLGHLPVLIQFPLPQNRIIVLGLITAIEPLSNVNSGMGEEQEKQK